MHRLKILTLTPDIPPGWFKSFDEILEKARPQLVPPKGYLESSYERVCESEYDPTRILLGATCINSPVGLADGRVGWPEPGTLIIGQIAVHHEWRNQGIGSALVKAILETARKKDCIRMLQAETLKEDSPASSFWLELGFSQIGPTSFILKSPFCNAFVEMQLHFRLAEPSELSACLEIRRLVFVEEQNVPLALERDGADTGCIHVVAAQAETLIATGRMRPLSSNQVKFERICVLRSYRGQGIGTQLLRFLEKTAVSRGFTSVRLAAQIEAIRLYTDLDYTPEGGIFMEAGIQHQQMKKKLF